MIASALSTEEQLRKPAGTGELEAFIPPAPIDASWLKPVWVRPYVFVAVVAVHLAIAFFFFFKLEETQTPKQEVQVTLIPKGEATTEVSDISAPQTAPAVSPDPPVDSAPVIADRDDPDVSKPSAAAVTPDLAPMLSAEAPKVEQPDAPAIVLADPKTPKTEKPTPAPTEKILQILRKEKQKVDARQAAMRAARLDKASAHSRTQAKDFSQGAAARHAGVQDGNDANARMSDASYAAIVSAEVGRHMIHATGIGRVVVFLRIGSSGAIISHSISVSSGNSALDAAANQMVAASHPPLPPPRGHFEGPIGINFRQ